LQKTTTIVRYCTAVFILAIHRRNVLTNTKPVNAQTFLENQFLPMPFPFSNTLLNVKSNHVINTTLASIQTKVLNKTHKATTNLVIKEFQLKLH